MTALKVLLVILLVLFLLGRIRVGGDGEYSADGLFVRVRVGPISVRVFPLKKKREKKEKKPAEKKKKSAPSTQSGEGEKAQEPEKPQKGGTLDLVKAGLPLVGEAAGELKERIRIDLLRMDLLFGGTDAAQTAILFGMSNALIAPLLAVFQQNFEVKEHRVRTAVDFNEKTITLYLRVAFSARIGQLLSFALRFGWKFLMEYQAVKKHNTMKKEAI